MLLKFKKLDVTKARIFQGVCVILSLLILAGYSAILYLKDNDSTMGILTSVSVCFMDLFNLLLYTSGNIKTPTEIVFLLVLNRALIIGLGESYWIYGYIVLYLVYAIVFIIQIARNYFPLEGDIVLKSAKLSNLWKKEEGKTKADAKEMLKKGFNNPELILILLSFLYLILMCVASALGGDDSVLGTTLQTVDFTV